MKNIKIYLIVAIATISFSALKATPLEEAIKDVDVSGSFRYRYDTFIVKKDSKDYSDAQLHKFKAQLTTSVSAGDGFKFVGTLNYNPDEEGDGGFNAITQTQLPIVLEEAYLRYDSSDIYATSILLGRQRLNTIWTDNDNLGGSVGMKAQLINTALPGATLTAFAVDSVNDDGDFVGADVTGMFANNEPTNFQGSYATLKDAIFAQNLYGAAVLLDYSESVGITGQAWFGYVNDRIAMYAADLGYTLSFGDAGSWSLQAQYLGNSPVSYLKSNEFKTAIASADMGEFGSGSLYTIATGVELFGFDASVGYTAYGKKDKLTLNVIEDMGDIITAGEEIQNLSGAGLHGDIGKNQIVFANLGYTIMDLVRIGADYAWGQTKIAQETGVDLKKTNQEVVGRLEYTHSDKLTFSSFYSYVTQKPKAGETEKQNNIRFEARYDF